MKNPTPAGDPAALPDQWRRAASGDHRGPCPALNSLANAGDLPRDGNVTVAELVRAMDERLGIPKGLGTMLAKLAMKRLGKAGPDGVERLTLDALTLHGFLEHDASLSRRDARLGDAAEIVPSLVDQLMSLSEDGRTLTLEDLATAHQLRMAQSAAGGHAVPLKAGVIGTFEAALLYQVLRRSHALDVADARELLESERVPANVAPRRVHVGSLLLTTLRLAVMGNWPFSRAAKRARDAAQKGAGGAAPGCPFPAAASPTKNAERGGAAGAGAERATAS
jgi:hypothetical protein